ncbi:MAG TPA: hypothetical protein VF281_03710 [Candidatus Saccharimonadales bacterium]
MNIINTILAATTKISPGDIGLSGQVGTGDAILANVLNAAYFWAGIVCVIIIIIAGYFYVTSAGNASTVKRAKDALMGAIIGLIVIIFATVITQFIIGRF